MKRLLLDARTGRIAEEDLTPAEVDELAATAAATAVTDAARRAALPDFGSDDAPLDQLKDAVTNLRAYLALPAPNNAQTLSALKLLIRVMLFTLRRLL